MSRLEPSLNFEVDLNEEKVSDVERDQLAGPLSIKEKRQELLDQFDNEVQKIQEVVVESPTCSYLKHAETLFKHGDYSLAKNLLMKALHENSYNEAAIKLMGLCNYEMKNYNEALSCFEKALEITESFENFSNIANVLYDLGDDSLAKKYYLHSVDCCEFDSPRLFEVFKNLGNIFVRESDYEVAEDYYNKAFTLDPDSDVLLVNYGTLEIQKGNLEKAVERFRDAVEINASNDKAWVGLALIHRTYGDIDLSRANIERSLDCKFDNETALNLLIDWSLSDLRYDQAIQRLEDYLAVHSDDYYMSFQLARLLTVCAKYNDARTEIERCISLSPEFEDASHLMAHIVEKQNQIEQEVSS